MNNKKLNRLAIVIMTIAISLVACSQNQKADYLIKVYNGEFDEVGIECGYVNSSGDTIIEVGKYHYCYTDTLKNYAIVLKKGGGCIAIDRNEKELFEVYWYDNGPDYIVDGFFRIKKDGKIGYANQNGEVVIKPQYDCAFPFKNGRAKVSVDCKTILKGEHQRWKSEHWIYIDMTGKKIE